MKRIVPLMILLAALAATIAGTSFTIMSYPKKVVQKYDFSEYQQLRQLHHQVILFIRAGKFQPAERLLYRLLKKLPGNSGTIGLLGKVLFLKKDYRHAENICRRFAAAEPENPVARNNLGEVLIVRGLLESGLRELLEAERLSKGAKYIQHNIFHAYLLLGKYDEAQRYWQLVQRKTDDLSVSILPVEAIVALPLRTTINPEQR